MFATYVVGFSKTGRVVEQHISSGIHMPKIDTDWDPVQVTLYIGFYGWEFKGSIPWDTDKFILVFQKEISEHPA